MAYFGSARRNGEKIAGTGRREPGRTGQIRLKTALAAESELERVVKFMLRRDDDNPRKPDKLGQILC